MSIFHQFAIKRISPMLPPPTRVKVNNSPGIYCITLKFCDLFTKNFGIVQVQCANFDCSSIRMLRCLSTVSEHPNSKISILSHLYILWAPLWYSVNFWNWEIQKMKVCNTGSMSNLYVRKKPWLFYERTNLEYLDIELSIVTSL